MSQHLTQASQDYLKAIYELTERHSRATTSQIAELLGVRPASVTGMLQKMAQEDPPLVEYRKHYGVTLTAAGKRAALETMRHHRLLERFLHEMLGYGWDEVHEEAERLEHVISEAMEQRIAEVLGHPQRDPHGQPIPTRDLTLAPVNDFPMSELRAGQTAVVERVYDEDADLLRYLGHIGLRPGVQFKIVDTVSSGQDLHIQLGEQPDILVISTAVADQIQVKLPPA